MPREEEASHLDVSNRMPAIPSPERVKRILRGPYGEFELDDLMAVRSIIEPAIPDMRAGAAVEAIADALMGVASPTSGVGSRIGTVLACYETHDRFLAHSGSRGVIDVLWRDGLAEAVFRSSVRFYEAVCGICGFDLADVQTHSAGGHHDRVTALRLVPAPVRGD